MCPDAFWPNIKNPLAPTPEEHEQHRTHREDAFIERSHKFGKPLLKMAKAPLKNRRMARRKKHG